MKREQLEGVLCCALNKGSIRPNENDEYIFTVNKIEFHVKHFKGESSVRYGNAHARFRMLSYRCPLRGKCGELSFQRNGHELFYVDLP